MKLKLNRTRTKVFATSQFGYCPLVWMFHCRKTDRRINHLQEIILRTVHDDYTSLHEDLLRKYNIQSLANKYSIISQRTSQTFRRNYTAQKMKFSIKDFFSNCDQIRTFLRVWSHLLKKFLVENFILCAVLSTQFDVIFSIDYNFKYETEVFCKL